MRLLFLVCLLPRLAGAVGDVCVVCRKEIRFQVYWIEDKVTRQKSFVCTDCLALPDVCYLCGLPVEKDFTTLPDGRTICKRDTAAVVLEEAEAVRLCAQVKDNLDRQFGRHLTLPETNVTVRLMDRVTLQELYRVIGNDYACPNTLGLTETKTNGTQRAFEISILSGMKREDLISTCVHEYAHTWVIENVSATRAERIGRDAVEGFCELLSFLYVEQNGLTAARTNILANFYTRGQIHLFIEAQRSYGLQDVVDWMQRGKDPLLLREDLSRVRWVEDLPKARPARTVGTSPPVTARSPNPPPPLPDKLYLKAITGSKARPLAIINDQNFAPNDLGRVRLAGTNLLIRCLEIRTNGVLLRLEQSGETQELHLPEPVR